MRTTDSQVIAGATEQCADNLQHLDLEDWITNPANVALTNDNGDVAMFERQYRQPNTVCGHYFFITRGADARKNAEQFLYEIFTGPYNVSVIIGLTPLTKLGALRMNKWLGFQEYYELDTEAGPCKMVMLTKKDWEELRLSQERNNE